MGKEFFCWTPLVAPRETPANFTPTQILMPATKRVVVLAVLQQSIGMFLLVVTGHCLPFVCARVACFCFVFSRHYL